MFVKCYELFIFDNIILIKFDISTVSNILLSSSSVILDLTISRAFESFNSNQTNLTWQGLYQDANSIEVRLPDLSLRINKNARRDALYVRKYGSQETVGVLKPFVNVCRIPILQASPSRKQHLFSFKKLVSSLSRIVNASVGLN